MIRSFLAACLLSALAFAQSTNPLTDVVKARYQSIRQNLTEAAEAMPEEHYGFKLTPAQRTYGQWIGHGAMGNYNFCAVIKGEQPPGIMSAIHDMTSKTDLTKAIRDSFAYCDVALEGMTDAKALAAKDVGGKTVYPVQGMVGVVASDNEHYGNIVGYLRSKGITPPSTARSKK